MTNLAANTDTRTDPDQAGSAENDTHQIWHNRDKSGLIRTVFRRILNPQRQNCPTLPEFSAQPSLRLRRPRLHHVHRVALAPGGGDVVPLGWVEGIRVVEVGSDELDVAFVAHALPEPDGFGREAAV